MSSVELTAREILLLTRALENRKEWIEKEGKKAQWRPSEISAATVDCDMLSTKLFESQE